MSAMLTRPVLPLPWRQALPALALVLFALALLYRETAATMIGIWSRSVRFAHAFLVPPIALWLIWRRRQFVAAMTPRPQPWLLAAIVIAAAGWLVGDLAGVNALAQLMFTTLLVLAVPALLGGAVARELAFPLGFVFFMVPIGDFLMPALMEATADFTVAALALSGVPVYREGLQFIIPSGSWSVVEACSGVRYLIASLMVGTLFAYLNYRSIKRRLVFCGVALLVPILANWVRAYMIVMLGHLSGNTIAVGVDHIIYGWVFFGIVIGLMFFIGSRWAEPDEEPTLPSAASRQAAAARPAAQWAAAAVVVVAAAAWPQLALWQFERGTAAAHPPTLALPDLAGVATSTAAPELVPVFLGPAAQASRVYGNGPGAVTVHVAYYRQQHYGHKLVSSENTLVRADDRQWNRTASGRRGIQIGERTVEFRTAEVLRGSVTSATQRERLEVRQVLWVDGRYTASDPWAIGLGVLGRLAGRGDDAAAITFYIAGPANTATAEALDNFVRGHLATIENQLGAIRAGR